jgi:methionyl-tRNA formyltransferase
VICQRIRAFNPFPGASTQLHGEVLKIWAAEVSPKAAPLASQYGQIVGLSLSGIEVVAIDSVLTISELQRPGGKRLGVADFLRGSSVQLGQVLG